MIADYEEIRDFIILHYCTTRRDDTPFWRACRNMVLPDSLQAKIDLFRVNGTLSEGLDQLFRSASWQSVMEGMGLRPRGYHPLVDRIPFEGTMENLDRTADALTQTVQGLPDHQQFIRDHCAAAPPERVPARA